MRPYPFFRILMAALLLAAPARADDHDRARAALEAGEIAPLADVLAAAERDFRGRMVEAELEDEDDMWIYELTLLTPGGTILRLDYDAKDATLIHAKGRGLLKWYKGNPEDLLDKVSPKQRAHLSRRLGGEAPPRPHRDGWFQRLWDGEDDRDHRHQHGWFESLWEDEPGEDEDDSDD